MIHKGLWDKIAVPKTTKSQLIMVTKSQLITSENAENQLVINNHGFILRFCPIFSLNQLKINFLGIGVMLL